MQNTNIISTGNVVQLYQIITERGSKMTEWLTKDNLFYLFNNKNK